MHLETTDQPTPDTQKPLILKSDLHLNPNEITTVNIMVDGATEHDTTGTVYPAEMYDDHDTVLICPALTTMTNRCVSLTINNMSSLPYTVPKNTHLATFSVMTPNEHKSLRPVNPVALKYLI